MSEKIQAVLDSLRIGYREGSALFKASQAAFQGIRDKKELCAISGQTESNVSMFLDGCRSMMTLIRSKKDGKLYAVPTEPDWGYVKQVLELEPEETERIYKRVYKPSE